MTTGITTRKIASGSRAAAVRARSDRLVFAAATTVPNRTISGSFWNCGAPPERVIAVAMVTAPATLAEIKANVMAIQSAAFGMVLGPASVVKITKLSVPTKRLLARLNAIFRGDCSVAATRASPDPTISATRYCAGLR